MRSVDHVFLAAASREYVLRDDGLKNLVRYGSEFASDEEFFAHVSRQSNMYAVGIVEPLLEDWGDLGIGLMRRRSSWCGRWKAASCRAMVGMKPSEF
jgi:hypothetical protein